MALSSDSKPLLQPAPSPLPPPPHPQPRFFVSPPPQPHDYVALPSFHPTNYHRLRHRRRGCLICTASILLLAGAVFLLWPSDPDLKIVRLRLEHIHIHTKPHIAIDISVLLTVKVRNVDVYSMDYQTVDAALGYRRKELGHVRSENGHVRARGSSYVDAELQINGVRVLGDWIFLIDDLAKGAVPFATMTEVTGNLGLLFFKFPLKAKASCDILVSTVNRTIIRQSC